jgi:NADH dehydrogenase FAD-containing subunit
MSRAEPVRVVILGGGFAGLNAATALDARCRGDRGRDHHRQP